MKPAMIIVNEKLLSTGMSQEEVDMLMGRYLEEEAQDYVECMNIIKEQFKSKENTILH